MHGEYVGRQSGDEIVPQDELLETVRLEDGEEGVGEVDQPIAAQVDQFEVDAGPGLDVARQQRHQVVVGQVQRCRHERVGAVGHGVPAERLQTVRLQLQFEQVGQPAQGVRFQTFQLIVRQVQRDQLGQVVESRVVHHLKPSIIVIIHYDRQFPTVATFRLRAR